MPPRFKSFAVLAFMLLVVWGLFWREDRPFGSGQHAVDVMKGFGEMPEVDETGLEQPGIKDSPPSGETDTSLPESTPVDELPPESSFDSMWKIWSPSSTASAELALATPQETEAGVPEVVEGQNASDTYPETTADTQNPASDLQVEFNNEYAELELNETTGAIYGTTLNTLVDAGAHAGFAAAALTPTESWSAYSDTPPYVYNPYPDYNSKVWKSANQGTYVPCIGKQYEIDDLLVYSGHPKIFGEPLIGSFIPLDIDSNLCFERETRLGHYGFESDDSPKYEEGSTKFKAWDTVNWGLLQEQCVKQNSDRYASVHEDQFATLPNPPPISNETSKRRRLDAFNMTVEEEEAKKHGLHGIPKLTITPKSRTAVILRTHTGQNYTENDKQNIRALVSELSLRSGGEYQIFLLVQVKDSNLAIWTDAAIHQEIIRNTVPKEFWNMTVLWNDAQMKELYPLIPEEINNVRQSHWLSVQKFAEDHPEFDYFWNWDFDSRYTGHYYNFLEKLATFAKAQPRKGLWERNERFYIPAFHGRYSAFTLKVEKEAGSDIIWGSPPNTKVMPVGPPVPVDDPNDDRYEWGVGEDADYISLTPIFNPVNTTWPGKNEVWGYSGSRFTPRRASIGTQSRCSKRLLNTMHVENLRGNHVSSEMTPQTVALLHGLKAVFAPIPIFFDRPWQGKSLQKYFNPGRKGESGSTEESPFSWGKEARFLGSTLHYKATPPMRLYNNWLGWEDSGVGGLEWERGHGRVCLPPMLLRPIKNVVKPPAGHASKSEPPY